MLKTSFPPITLIGAGNLATHLAFALHSHGFYVHSFLSKSGVSAEKLAHQFSSKKLSNFQEIPAENLVFICVNDAEIQSVASELNHVEQIAFTAGNVSINSIQSFSKIGVFYPLQTFSKSKKVNFNSIPILIESENEQLQRLLVEIGEILSERVEIVTSTDRKEIHLAAVFVNNFTNHLFYLADNQLAKSNLDWTILKPLISETIEKLTDQTPFEAQTGPARRNDEQTISDHLSRLSGTTKLIYEDITQSITQLYSDKNEKL